MHELGHHPQTALPGLQHYFAQLHARRTAGEAARSLREMTGISAYAEDEVKKDAYADPYYGRVYGGGEEPLEVLTMTYQALLTDDRALRLALRRDPELLHLGLGVLFRYAP